MGGFDGATWQALGLTVTLLGLVVTALVWRRRGPASGTRALAWSLLPLAAGLTGVLRLGWDIADSVGSWAVRLVFSPVVWLGVVVAGVSAALFVVSGFLGRHTRPKAAKQKAQPASLPAKGRPPAKAPGATPADDDLADIEALLRKHGIS
jgi:heme exporter protein D